LLSAAADVESHESTEADRHNRGRAGESAPVALGLTGGVNRHERRLVTGFLFEDISRACGRRCLLRPR
jgi:hypothetical protein